MKKFDITLLGVNSALPVNDRFPTCQIINYDERLIMIDCGEGAQAQLTRYGIRRMKIDHILISHLHGDHCYGLPGVLTSFALYNRKHPLSLHGPKGVKAYIEGVLQSSEAHLPYTLDIFEYDASESNEFFLGNHLRVTTIPLDHRIATLGYRIQEYDLPRNIDADKIRAYNLNVEEIKQVKQGLDVQRADGVLVAEDCLLPRLHERSYAFCSDTKYAPSIVQYIEGVNVLYHETTYLKELESLAQERMHTTLEQAVSIAKQAAAKCLLSGHYSSRYSDLSEFEKRGAELFENFILGKEGLVIPVS